jgi:hypothetical protein
MRKFFFTPAGLTIFTTVVSVLCLAIPQSYYGRIWLRGEPLLNVTSIAQLGLLYVPLVAFLMLGGLSAARSTPRKVVVDRSTEIWLVWTTIFAAVGVLYTLLQIASSLGVNGMIQSVMSGQANELKEALYADYSLGFSSLRYISIVSFPVAAFVALSKTGRMKIDAITIVNAALLVATISISSRLALIMSAIIFITLATRGGLIKSIAPFIPIVIVIFLLLVISNATRNYNYYASIGIYNPIQAALAEIITYLSSPAQGALTAASHLFEGRSLTTGIDPSLTTNSAIFDFIRREGELGLIAALFTCTIYAILFHRAINSGSVEIIAGCGAILYAFAEIWRVYLFDQGLFYTVLLATFGAHAFTRVTLLFLPRKTRLRPTR